MHFAHDSNAPSTATPAAITPYMWLVASIAALGGLLFGYDWVVIGGAAKFYEGYFQLTDEWARGWAQSCALLGCLVGALLAGWTSDRFGRKPVLLGSALIFLGSSVGIALTDSFTSFWLWRILGGVGIGLASGISPLYIAEIAPTRIRGMLVALNQFTIVIGVLAAQIVNWQIAEVVPKGQEVAAFQVSWNVQHGWRWMFAACAVPSLLFVIGAVLVPESPRWLAARGRRDQARGILGRIGGEPYAASAMAEMAEVPQGGDRGVRWADLLDRRVLGVLALGCFLAVFQQWCGINVIFNYAGDIFAEAGYDLNDVLTNIVATGIVNLVFTVVAMVTIDRLGRRWLLLVGSSALAVMYVGLGACYALKAGGTAVPPMLFLGFVLAAIGAYAMSLAPVTWVVISEIFPSRIRGTAMSLAVAMLWIACFILTITFPVLNRVLGAAGTFWTYAGICALGLVVVAWKIPETKGRSLEEIDRAMGGDDAGNA